MRTYTLFFFTEETMIISMNRSLKDSLSKATKLKDDHLEAVIRTEALLTRLELEKARRNALSSLLDDTRNELQILQEKSVSTFDIEITS